MVAKARTHTHEHLFHKLTSPAKGLPRLVDQPPLLSHFDENVASQRDIDDFFLKYSETLPEERRILFDRFKFVDAALKVVGVGSVGTRCFVALFLAAPNDPLFLQVKEARRSVLEPYTRSLPVDHNGQRIVIGQRLMQSASDIFLGWSRGIHDHDYYVRQLRDMKVAPDLESQSPAELRKYAELCGLALARAHDKAGDAALIAGYMGSRDRFDEAIGDYAVAYADQVERDFESFVQAVRNGRLKSDLSESELAGMLR